MKCVVRIEQDDAPFDPFEEFDQLGTLVCWTRHYQFGKKHDFAEPQDFLDWAKEQGVIKLPVSILDHSGVTMYVGSEAHWSDPGGWDSGQVGWIYVTLEDVQKEYGDLSEISIHKARAVLRSEIEQYDQYLRGDVWGIIVEDEDTGEQLDSCWGFYGREYAEEEAARMLAFAKEQHETLVLDFNAA